jgi:hypothetical protein
MKLFTLQYPPECKSACVYTLVLVHTCVKPYAQFTVSRKRKIPAFCLFVFTLGLAILLIREGIILRLVCETSRTNFISTNLWKKVLYWSIHLLLSPVSILSFIYKFFICGGTRWRSWLRHCASSWKAAGSIPDGVIGIFNWHNPGLWVYSVSTRNTFWRIMAAGTWEWHSYHFHVSIV